MIKTVAEGLKVYKETLKEYLVWFKAEEKKEDPEAFAANDEAITRGKKTAEYLSTLKAMAKVLKLSIKERGQIHREVEKEIETLKSRKK